MVVYLHISLLKRFCLFQVKIIVSPHQDANGGGSTEIRVTGGIPRPTSRKLPPIHNSQGISHVVVKVSYNYIVVVGIYKVRSHEFIRRLFGQHTLFKEDN